MKTVCGILLGFSLGWIFAAKAATLDAIAPDISPITLPGLMRSLSHGVHKDYDPRTKSPAEYRAIRVNDKGEVICSK